MYCTTQIALRNVTDNTTPPLPSGIPRTLQRKIRKKYWFLSIFAGTGSLHVVCYVQMIPFKIRLKKRKTGGDKKVSLMIEINDLKQFLMRFYLHKHFFQHNILSTIKNTVKNVGSLEVWCLPLLKTVMTCRLHFGIQTFSFLFANEFFFSNVKHWKNAQIISIIMAYFHSFLRKKNYKTSVWFVNLN